MSIGARAMQAIDPRGSHERTTLKERGISLEALIKDSQAPPRAQLRDRSLLFDRVYYEGDLRVSFSSIREAIDEEVINPRLKAGETETR